MKWILFTGTWRLTNEEVEKDVREYTRKVINEGNGIITGGATGVDYFCIDEYLKIDPECSRIRVFIPEKLNHFINDYKKNWCQDPISIEDIEKLSESLNRIKAVSPASLLELNNNEGDITQDIYNMRNDEEITYSDEVYAFQVNNSAGTQDTIDKAKDSGLSITIHKKYII